MYSPGPLEPSQSGRSFNEMDSWNLLVQRGAKRLQKSPRCAHFSFFPHPVFSALLVAKAPPLVVSEVGDDGSLGGLQFQEGEACHQSTHFVPLYVP